MKDKHDSPAYVLAVCSLLAALGIVMMLSSSLIPVLTYASPLLAGVMLIPVLTEFGARQAWMTWCVTATLSMLLCTDREAAFFYSFLGYYPILKPRLEQILSKGLRIIIKLCIFLAAITLLFLLLVFVMGLEDMKAELLLNIAVYAMLVLVMMIYDQALNRIWILYMRRLRQKLFGIK